MLLPDNAVTEIARVDVNAGQGQDSRSRIDRVRCLLTDWLKKSSWQPSEFVRLLLGYGLPPVGYDDPPFVWLLRGLPAEAHLQRPLELAWAQRAAELIVIRTWDVGLSDIERQDLYYNLFNLCAGLACPQLLADPLFAFQKDVRNGKVDRLVSQSRGALRDALVHNQLDKRLEPVWVTMLSGRLDDVLPGDRYTGFEGIRLMPDSPEQLGRPAMSSIGEALNYMADGLKDNDDRRHEFHRLLEAMTKTYPDQHGWQNEFVKWAERLEWPDWAAECICFARPLERIETLWLFPKSCFECLPDDLKVKSVATTCRDSLHKMQPDQRLATIINAFSQDGPTLRALDGDERTRTGAVRQMLYSISTTEKSRKTMLSRMGVGHV